MQKEAQICDMNIAHALTRGMGWGSCEPPEPADEGRGVKHPLTPEAPDFSSPYRFGLALTFIPSLLFSWEGLLGERK
ncbi:MAG: hypothetical protein V6S10_00090 [Candidatus Methanoglobus sp.]